MYRSGQTTNLNESLEYSWDFFNKTLLTAKKTTKLMTVNIALLIYLTSLRFENAKTNCIPRHKSSPNTLKIKYKKWWTCTLYWRHCKTSCTVYMLVAYEEYACVIHVLSLPLKTTVSGKHYYKGILLSFLLQINEIRLLKGRGHYPLMIP